MIKIIGIILAVIILGRIVFRPAYNFINNLIQDNKTESEEPLIGLVSRHNPRVEEIQQILKDADFEPGPVDGMMGAQTRGAIREFQKANQLRPTGKIDSATRSALNREKEALKQQGNTNLSAEPFTHEANVTLNNEGLISAKQDAVKKTELHSEIVERRLTTKDRMRQIQAALKKAGFYKGEIDGKIGPKTRRAIVAFQRSKRLKPDGVVGSKTWEELSKYLKD